MIAQENIVTQSNHVESMFLGVDSLMFVALKATDTLSPIGSMPPTSVNLNDGSQIDQEEVIRMTLAVDPVLPNVSDASFVQSGSESIFPVTTPELIASFGHCPEPTFGHLFPDVACEVDGVPRAGFDSVIRELAFLLVHRLPFRSRKELANTFCLGRNDLFPILWNRPNVLVVACLASLVAITRNLLATVNARIDVLALAVFSKLFLRPIELSRARTTSFCVLAGDRLFAVWAGMYLCHVPIIAQVGQNCKSDWVDPKPFMNR